MSGILEAVFRKFKCFDLVNAEYKRRATSQRANIVAPDSHPIDSAFFNDLPHERCPRSESVERIEFDPFTIIDAIIKWSLFVLHVVLSFCRNERVRQTSRTIFMTIFSWFLLCLDFVVGKVSSPHYKWVPSGLSLVSIQYKSENNPKFSKIIVEKFNNAFECFERVSEIQIWNRKYFGVLLLKNKVFVLGGHNVNGYLKSVSKYRLDQLKIEQRRFHKFAFNHPT